MDGSARPAAEAAARLSYGRLLAVLARRTRDIAAAEDALAEAFARALRVWPESGIPDAPEAWLLTTARRVIGHGERAGKVREATATAIELSMEEAALRDTMSFPDERMKLMFVCAHPAIDEAVRTPLMLQTVLGLDAARIASAFLTAPATMAQRLVRAKAKIRDAGLAFEIPDPRELPQRLGDVLDAIYAAYGAGWDGIAVADSGVRDLTEEAIWLGRVAVALVPDEPEAKGLLALMLYCEARKGARRGADGAFVPLAQQDPKLWSHDMIVEAERLLTAASRAARFGRYQCEAAIQSVHCQRAITGRTNWGALLTLYDLLSAHAPTIGVLTSRAAVLSETDGGAKALEALDALDRERVSAYQPYWVTRANVLEKLGCKPEAKSAFDRAIGLTEDETVRRYLSDRKSALP